MTYLVIGLDRRSYTSWSRWVRRCDVAAAASAAVDHAAADGVDLVIAAVIGPDAVVLDVPIRPLALATAA